MDHFYENCVDLMPELLCKFHDVLTPQYIIKTSSMKHLKNDQGLMITFRANIEDTYFENFHFIINHHGIVSWDMDPPSNFTKDSLFDINTTLNYRPNLQDAIKLKILQWITYVFNDNM